MLATSLVGLFLLVGGGTAVKKVAHIRTGEYNPAVDMSFCNFKCGRNKAGISKDVEETHVACNCHSESIKNCTRFEEKSMPDFRLAMTIAHNKLRNAVALGKRKKRFTFTDTFEFPQASDMNAVSYDLSLEYSATCSANKCREGVDLCIKASGFKYVAQNDYLLWFLEGWNSSVYAQKAVDHWFKSHIGLSHDILNKYEEGTWETATAMLWSSVESIGCAIHERQKPHMILIVCNYGSQRDINNVGVRVYREGKPGTQCMERGSHDNEFPGLCGQVNDVPIAPLTRGGGGPLVDTSASGKYGSPMLSKQSCVEGNRSFGFLVLLLAWHF